jgi:hypothetical protein
MAIASSMARFAAATPGPLSASRIPVVTLPDRNAMEGLLLMIPRFRRSTSLGRRATPWLRIPNRSALIRTSAYIRAWSSSSPWARKTSRIKSDRRSGAKRRGLSPVGNASAIQLTYFSSRRQRGKCGDDHRDDQRNSRYRALQEDVVTASGHVQRLTESLFDHGS